MSAHLYALLGWIRETSLGRNFKWNTSSSTVVLPQEIKDEILSYLWDDKRTLGACALACRAFLDPSQKLIFSKVIVSPPTPKRRARSSTTQRPGLTTTRLARLLESIPRLCRYVQHLEIRDEEDEWLLKDTSIPQILPRFINLRALVINYRKFRYSDIVSWPDNFLCALLSAIHLPSFKYLSVTEMPLALLEHGQHLTHLYIRDLTFQKLPFHACSSCNGKLSLSSLGIDALPDYDGEEFLHILRDKINTTHIRRLFAHPVDTIEGHSVLWSVLKDCVDTLEELVFIPCSFITDPEVAIEEPVDWTTLRFLRVFATRVEMISHDDSEDGGSDSEELSGAFHWLNNVLKDMSSSKGCLEEITIQANYELAESDVELPHWDGITTMLLDRTRFPRLKKVEIKVASFLKHDIKDLLQEVEEYADRLRQESIQPLDVTVSPAEPFAPLRPFYS